MNSNPTSKRFWTYYALFTKRKCHNVSFRTRFALIFYEEMYMSFFLAHPIVRFADSLQKKGDYSHQTSKKINAIQYNEKSDLFRSCLFSLLLRIWGFFCWKFEHPSTSCETVDLSFEVLQDYFANIYLSCSPDPTTDLYSCNKITKTLIQISRFFYFDFFSKTNHQMMI